MDKPEVIHITCVSTKLGIASHLLRAMAKIYCVYPKYIFMDWTKLFLYQNVRGENVWDIIYNQPDVEVPDKELYEVRMESEWRGEQVPLGLPLSTESDARNAANKIINEKFRLKDDIKNEIESFYEKNMKDKKILAIHHRGCSYDGKNAMSTKEFNNHIGNILDDEDFDAVFICSDTKKLKGSIISYVKDRNLEAIIYDSHITDIDSSTGLPWDEGSDIDKNLMAKEIIIEIYLMARCHSILRTRYSGVSLFVLHVNPDIIEYSV